MKPLISSLIAGILGVAALGFTAASASDRPDYCDRDHDHRNHASNYYDYYPSDKYSRTGSTLRVSLSVGDDRRDYDRRDNNRRDDRGRHNNNRGKKGRIVNREVYDTRYKARILLTEEVVRNRRGSQLVCTVRAVGPQARRVPDRRLYTIAHRECSRRAQIRVYT